MGPVAFALYDQRPPAEMFDATEPRFGGDPAGGVEISKRGGGAGVLADSKADGYRRASMVERVERAAGILQESEERGSKEK